MQRKETQLVTLRRVGQSVLVSLLATLRLTQPAGLAAAYVKTDAEERIDAQRRAEIFGERLRSRE